MSLVPFESELGEDGALLVRTARDFARDELLPRDRVWDVDESSAWEVLPRLGEMGFLGLLIPQEFGGLGCGYVTYAALLHELARYSPSVCVTISVHNMVGAILSQWAKGALRDRWLRGWSEASSFGAFSVSEANAGSEPTAVTTEAVETNDGYRVTGEKMWVTNGMNAAWFLTLVRLKSSQTGAGEKKGPHSGPYEEREPRGGSDGKLCALMIAGDSPGLTRDKIRGKMGIRGSETAVISLANVLVPKEHLLGEPGEGWTACQSGLIGGRIGIASQATGIAEAALEEMTAYAKQREQFGKPIGKFQAVGDMIAQSAVELEAAKLLVRRAASELDRGNATRSLSSMAKLYASEAANRIAYRAVQVHGGTGYVHECRAEQLYRDARITTIYEGTSEIQRILIARELGRG